MANRVHRFKDRDIKRVIKAARDAGVGVGSITVNPVTGAITVATAQPGETADGNDLDNWLRKKDAHPA